jgi:predicted RNase H-like HicB family nuclease
MKYAVVIERGPTSYGASVPDLPGCIAVGRTRSEVEQLIQEAITVHLAGLRADGLPVPEPQTQVTTVEV